MKCSAISIDGVWHDVRKEPVTDPGKRSKAGRFALVEIEGEVQNLNEYVTVPLVGPLSNHEDIDMLRTVYENGIHYNDEAWGDIYTLAHSQAVALANHV